MGHLLSCNNDVYDVALVPENRLKGELVGGGSFIAPCRRKNNNNSCIDVFLLLVSDYLKRHHMQKESKKGQCHVGGGSRVADKHHGAQMQANYNGSSTLTIAWATQLQSS